jgi:O-antigen ligase
VLIANNVYAQLLAETGLLGGLAFAAGALSIGLLAVRRMRHTDGDWILTIQAALAGLAAISVNLLTGPSFTILFQWALVGLICAAIVGRAATDRAHLPVDAIAHPNQG